MEKKYPQRLFIQGNEPQVDKINNSCRMSILTKMKEALPLEYAIVQKDPVFAPIFALHENSLGYSGRLIHSMLTRQLVTKTKDEMWFVFGKKPLRFSMQEFHAVTGLNCKDDFSSDIEKWTDDGGFWSKLLKAHGKVWIQKLLKVILPQTPSWKNPTDRVRLVYLCLIAGVVCAIGEKKNIPEKYIQLVMDLDKVISKQN